MWSRALPLLHSAHSGLTTVSPPRDRPARRRNSTASWSAPVGPRPQRRFRNACAATSRSDTGPAYAASVIGAQYGRQVKRRHHVALLALVQVPASVPSCVRIRQAERGFRCPWSRETTVPTGLFRPSRRGPPPRGQSALWTRPCRRRSGWRSRRGSSPGTPPPPAGGQGARLASAGKGWGFIRVGAPGRRSRPQPHGAPGHLTKHKVYGPVPPALILMVGPVT